MIKTQQSALQYEKKTQYLYFFVNLNTQRRYFFYTYTDQITFEAELLLTACTFAFLDLSHSTDVNEFNTHYF